MSISGELRESFSNSKENTWSDKGIDYTDTDVEDFRNRDITREALPMNVEKRNEKDGGRVNSMLGAARTNYNVDEGFWK